MFVAPGLYHGVVVTNAPILHRAPSENLADEAAESPGAWFRAESDLLLRRVEELARTEPGAARINREWLESYLGRGEKITDDARRKPALHAQAVAELRRQSIPHAELELIVEARKQFVAPAVYDLYLAWIEAEARKCRRETRTLLARYGARRAALTRRAGAGVTKVAGELEELDRCVALLRTELAQQKVVLAHVRREARNLARGSALVLGLLGAAYRRYFPNHRVPTYKPLRNALMPEFARDTFCAAAMKKLVHQASVRVQVLAAPVPAKSRCPLEPSRQGLNALWNQVTRSDP